MFGNRACERHRRRRKARADDEKERLTELPVAISRVNLGGGRPEGQRSRCHSVATIPAVSFRWLPAGGSEGEELTVDAKRERGQVDPLYLGTPRFARCQR